MPSNLANLEKAWEEVEAVRKALPALTGTPEEIAIELLGRCADREESLRCLALESERAGDEDYTWLCMAGRAENNRLRAKIYAVFPHLKPV